MENIKKVMYVNGKNYTFIKKINKNLYLFENTTYGFKECFDKNDVIKYSNPDIVQKRKILEEKIKAIEKEKKKIIRDKKYQEYQKQYQEEYRKNHKGKMAKTNK